MPPLLRNHPVIIAIAALLVALLTWGFWPQPVLVEVTRARQAPLTITIEEEGRTRLKDRYVISAPVDGVTCRLQLDVGDPVQEGQMLLGITPLESRVLDARSRTQAKARVAAAESALQAAREQARAAAEAHKLAATELKRLRPLLKQGAVSRDAFDRAVTNTNTTAAARRSAGFSVDVARYELEAARSVLEYAAGEASDTTQKIKVRSPVTGTILRIDHECAGPVHTGETLLEVGDPAALEIEVDVLSADAVKISTGMRVQFDRWGGEQPLEGIVRVVEPVGFTKVSALGVEEQRVLVICDFTSPEEQWQRLGDGYRVEARFILWHQDRVLQVPANSLFRFEDGWALFVASDHRAHRRAVKVGQRNGLRAQILEGIEEGEVVIIHPGDEVENGLRISIHGDQG